MLNHHRIRYKKINSRLVTNAYLRCLAAEDQEYIILYLMANDKKIFLQNLYSKLKKVDIKNKQETERLEIISDIITYFKEEKEFKTTQHLISMDMLLFGFVAKDQKGDSNIREYREANKIIVKEHTKFYFDCQIECNKTYYSKENQLCMLKKWSQKTKEFSM